MMTLEQDRTDPSIRTSQDTVPGVSPPPHASRALRFVVAGCLIVSLLSLTLSAFMLYSLLDVRRTATEGLDAAIAALDGFGGKGFQYEYPLNQEIPISADIPINQELTFPFEGTFPISTTVEVPIKAGLLGTFVIAVPIDTSVDVNTSVPIRLNESFHIETTVPVSMTIPIDIQPGDLAVQELLKGIREWLLRLRDSM